MENIKTIIFDYDGTIHDSTKIYSDAFRIVYQQMVKEGEAPWREFSD